jgi:hypothetical protein
LARQNFASQNKVENRCGNFIQHGASFHVPSNAGGGKEIQPELFLDRIYQSDAPDLLKMHQPPLLTAMWARPAFLEVSVGI